MADVDGFDPSLHELYKVMLSSQGRGVEEIARHLGISGGEVRERLDQLAARGLLRPASDGSGLRAIHPTLGLAALTAEAEADIAARRRRLADTQAAMAALVSEHHTADFVVRLHGVDAVRDRLEELATKATVECLSLNPKPSQTPDAMQASKPLNKSMLERGVAVRCVYQASFANDSDLLDYARWLQGMGGEAVTVPVIPVKLVIFDRRTALLPIDPADSVKGAVETSHPGVLATVGMLFDLTWSIAAPFGTAVLRSWILFWA